MQNTILIIGYQLINMRAVYRNSGIVIVSFCALFLLSRLSLLKIPPHGIYCFIAAITQRQVYNLIS